jgi:hypothetical protein
MTSLFKKLINPLEKMAKNEVNSLINKAENSLLGSVSDSLGRLGLSSKSKSGILASLGDSILSGIASEFFGGFSGDINRMTKREIIENTGFTGAGGGDANVDSLDNSGVTGSGTSKTIGGYQFPADLDKYYISFGFRKYERLSPNKTVKPIVLDNIALPLPRDLQEKMEVAYNTGATGLAGNVIDTFGAEDLTKTIEGAGGYAAVYASADLAGVFGDGLKSALSQYIGATVNPVVSVTFESPKLRSHSFSWTFAPNNAEESNAIRNIIKTFKQNALPNFASDTTAVLTYPNMCVITLHPWGATGKSDSYMYQFKTCMIESVSVNYAPDAVVFFNNDAPGFVKLDINVIEVEYFTAKDFGIAPNTNAKNIFGTKVEDAKNAFNAAMAQITPDTTDKPTTPPAGQPAAGTTPTTGIGITPDQHDLVYKVPIYVSDTKKTITLYQNRAGQWYENTGDAKLKPISNITDWQYTQGTAGPAVRAAITASGAKLNSDTVADNVPALTDSKNLTLFADNNINNRDTTINSANSTGSWTNKHPTVAGTGALENGPVSVESFAFGGI